MGAIRIHVVFNGDESLIEDMPSDVADSEEDKENMMGNVVSQHELTAKKKHAEEVRLKLESMN